MDRKFMFRALVFLILSGFLVDAEYANLTEYPGELCSAECVKGQTRTCYFVFNLELYHAMGPACGECERGVDADCFKPQCIVGDLHEKGVMSINRMIPGPAIQVCQGDLVVVDVKNMAHGTAASIHWHGLHMVETPYMDGVPYVTQCPILFETTFRYQFRATEPGTHFYHSHSGHHKLNGQYGAIIVRRPDEDNPHLYEYDVDKPEHYILISDWKHVYGETTFPGLPRGESFPDSLLINGKGTYVDRETLQHNRVPVVIFYVEPGYRYKFNLINSLSLTEAVQIQIEGHTMTVLATDSYDVEPFEIDSLVSNAGERYDLIIETNQSKGDYWIRCRGINNFQPQPTDTFALLRYVTRNSDYRKPQPPFPSYNETYPIGDRLNYPEATCFDSDEDYCVADLKSLKKNTDLVTKEPDHRFELTFYNDLFDVDKVYVEDKYVRYDNPDGFTIANGVVNNVSNVFSSRPILTQFNEIDKNEFCEKSECPEKCNGEPKRECIHVKKVKQGSLVEMVFIDGVKVDGLHHPFHVHGHNFVVMGITNDTSNLEKAMQFAGQKRTAFPVVKDTVSVPSNGLVVIRFYANNFGAWLVHCHYELHLATGMAFILLVGESDEWVPAPENFPKCGNYMPEVVKSN